MTPPESQSVALELERLRGTCAEGFAEVKGSLAVLVERSNRTEQDVRDLREEMEEEFRKLRDEEVKPLKARVDASSARQWPIPSVAVLLSAGALALAVWQAVGG